MRRAVENDNGVIWKVTTYAVCGGDDDGTGDEGQAVIHADLQCSFPVTRREPAALRLVCGQ